jgi:hypothetical protein
LLECPVATHHQVANDQQGPAISEYLQRHTHRAPGTMQRGALFSHLQVNLAKIACELQVNFTLHLSILNARIFSRSRHRIVFLALNPEAEIRLDYVHGIGYRMSPKQALSILFTFRRTSHGYRHYAAHVR